MHNGINYIEKRKERRFDLEIFASVSFRKKSVVIQDAKIEDISLHGLKFITENYLEPGKNVEISYLNNKNGKITRILGCIKWQYLDNNKYKNGIELFHSNTCWLFMDQKEPSTPEHDTDSNQSEINNKNNFEKNYTWPGFHFELYWGLFLKTFLREIEYNLVRISSDYSLSSVFLEKILHDFPEMTLPAEVSQNIQAATNTVQKANNDLSKITTLFQIMVEENISKNREASDSAHQEIDLNKLLDERLNSLKKKSDWLMPQKQSMILHEPAVARKIFGQTWKIGFGVDFLLLHSCQFLLYKKASSLNLNLRDDKRLIILELKNNGSGMLYGEQEVVLRLDKDISDNLRASDRRQLTWLQYTLIFFHEYNPTIKIKSVSGKNNISLILEVD